MNDAHLHLILVHIPIVLVPVSTIIILLGLWSKNKTMKVVSLNLFVFSSIFAGIAFLLGEGAEEAVEHLAGIVESNIEAHEDAATFALWLTLGLGVLSLFGLWGLRFKEKLANTLIPIVVILSVIASGALAYTGQQGGKIRHPEAFPDSTTQLGSDNKHVDND